MPTPKQQVVSAPSWEAGLRPVIAQSQPALHAPLTNFVLLDDPPEPSIYFSNGSVSL